MQRITKRLSIIFLCFLSIGMFFVIELTLKNYLSGQTVTVASKNFTEQEILGEIISIVLEEKGDIKVKRNFNLDGTLVTFHAMRSNSIDIWPAYTGTALIEILKEEDVKGKDLEWLRKEYLKKFDIEWIEPLGCENHYVFLVDQDSPITTLQELANQAKVKIGMGPEFIARPEYKMICKAYQMQSKPLSLEDSLIYMALEKGNIDAGLGYSTDGRIDKYNLRVLEDDKYVLPSYEVAPVVRGEILKKHPQIRTLLLELQGSLTNETMQELNTQVDSDHKRPYDVARAFLVENGFL